MNGSASVGVVVLVLVCLACAPVAMGSPGTDGSSGFGQLGAHQPSGAPYYQTAAESENAIAGSQDFDQTTFEITVHEDGSATWTFRHEQQFDANSTDREAFEAFAEDFESNETGLYNRFTEQAAALIESGSERTDREMGATNFQRSARIEEQFGTRGIVEMSFTWEGFASVDGGIVEVGDVFQNIYLAEEQAIVIKAGDGLTFDRIEPDEGAQHSRESLENADSVRWSGEQQFLDGQPRVVFVTDDYADGGSESDSVLSALPGSSDTAQYVAVGALVGLALGAGAIWYRRNEVDGGGGSGETATSPTASSDGVTESDAESGAPPAAADESAADEPAASEAEPLSEEELLTDEDRVVKLIRENGGRMKQVNIVEETGWSKSKVSMLLSDMEDEGTISKLRVGRENIISLEGFEPEATKSPFDE